MKRGRISAFCRWPKGYPHITTLPTPSINYEQVNNFFPSIKQFLQAQTNNLPPFYHAPY